MPHLGMRDIVALWAPDIEPPADWLVPAILYQDKIRTFVDVVLFLLSEPLQGDHDLVPELRPRTLPPGGDSTAIVRPSGWLTAF